MNKLPMADSAQKKDDKVKIKKIIAEKQMVGAANNTKWNELITVMREKQEWQPSYRYQWINGYISNWDVEWAYHLPFPFIGVEWFDIGLHQDIKTGQLLENKIIDHTHWISELLNKIGFEYEISGDVARVWGYFPKSYNDFPPL